MEEKLKSILRQIPWSLLLRAVIFAAAWYFLPFWFFALVALYLCFVPPFQSRMVAVPSLALVVLGAFQPQSIFAALIFGAAFLYILLIKDLLVIDRRSAYEILVLFLSFLSLRDFYMMLGGNPSGAGLILSAIPAIMIAILLSDFLFIHSRREGEEGKELKERKSLRRVIAWIVFIISWQLILAGLFLSVDFTYQAVIIFLSLLLVIDLTPQYFFGTLNREKTLTTGSVVFVMIAIVMSSARWGL